MECSMSDHMTMECSTGSWLVCLLVPCQVTWPWNVLWTFDWILKCSISGHMTMERSTDIWLVSWDVPWHSMWISQMFPEIPHCLVWFLVSAIFPRVPRTSHMTSCFSLPFLLSSSFCTNLIYVNTDVFSYQNISMCDNATWRGISNMTERLFQLFYFF